MKTWTKQQALTHTILLILLIADFSQSLLVLIYDDLLSPSVREIYIDQFKFWIISLYWFILLGIPLIVLVIRLNRDQLQKLNMDRLYVVMLITAGLIGLYVLPYNCFAIIAVIYVVYIVLDHKVKFGVFDSNTLRMILSVVGIFAGIMFFITSLSNTIRIDPNAEQSLRAFLLESIPNSIYEEAVYRGMLYMFLKDLGMSEVKVICAQALLFWIKHINYLFASPVTFWIVLPILGLLLGYIVFRSKSLTPSTIAHVLYNAFAGFIVF
jgi:membrane protease YdiL (CAAX protease family)